MTVTAHGAERLANAMAAVIYDDCTIHNAQEAGQAFESLLSRLLNKDEAALVERLLARALSLRAQTALKKSIEELRGKIEALDTAVPSPLVGGLRRDLAAVEKALVDVEERLAEDDSTQDDAPAGR